MKYEINNRWNGKAIFTAEIDAKESDSEGFKLGLAVQAAVKAGANLANANLAYANLECANLARTNLAYANLECANLAYANLAYANLAYANLADANLEGADMEGAILVGANLEGVKAYGYKFTRAPIMIYTEHYTVEIWEGLMKIGCEPRTLAEWSKITEDDVEEMGGENAAKLWKSWKKPLLAIAKADGRMKLPKTERKNDGEIY